MNLLYSILMMTMVLVGCAGVDPSAADRERNRQVATTLPQQCCFIHDFPSPVAPVGAHGPT